MTAAGGTAFPPRERRCAGKRKQEMKFFMDTGKTVSSPAEENTGRPVSAALRETGEFCCSNHLVNILAERMVRAQKELFSAPASPDRETLLLLSDAASFNLDLREFFLKRLAEGRTDEGCAGIVMLDQLYRKYGETEAVRQFLPAAAARLDSAGAEAADRFAEDPAPESLVGPAMLAGMNLLCARLALALGETRIANERNALYRKRKEAFLKEFYTEKGRFRESSQTGAVLALRFGLTPDDRDLWALVVDSLLKDIEKKRAMHFSTGLLGTAYLLPVLTDAEALDTAWQLFLQSSRPSWLYPVIRQGAPPCVAWSAVSQWLFETVCGIRPDFGARRFMIAPRFGRFLRYARARYDSVYGPVTSEWRREDEDFILDFTVPRGTGALVRGKLYGPGKFTLKIRHY